MIMIRFIFITIQNYFTVYKSKVITFNCTQLFKKLVQKKKSNGVTNYKPPWSEEKATVVL